MGRKTKGSKEAKAGRCTCLFFLEWIESDVALLILKQRVRRKQPICLLAFLNLNQFPLSLLWLRLPCHRKARKLATGFRFICATDAARTANSDKSISSSATLLSQRNTITPITTGTLRSSTNKTLSCISSRVRRDHFFLLGLLDKTSGLSGWSRCF